MRSLVNLFKALSDETRLRILSLLQEGELCVCELMDALQMPQPRISHQLRILKGAGLVTDRREGKWIIYALEAKAEDPAFSLLRMLRDLMVGGTFERDRAYLKGTLARGLRTSCRADPSALGEEVKLAEKASS